MSRPLTLIASAMLLFAVATFAVAAEDDNAKPASEDAFREPFTLKLHVDREHYYEERFERQMPYLFKGDVYLFCNDDFGINVVVNMQMIRSIQYQPDSAKADVTFKFTQDIKEDGSTMMLLIIKNNTKYTLEMDGFMTAPGKVGIAKTSILPVKPGLASYESWPHPIVQLVLARIRVG
jgi:hypothetical protein